MNALSERPTAAAATTPPARRSRLPLVAAVAYLLTWVAGLSVFSSSTEVRASGAEVLANVRGHEAAATTQYLLTEGLTAVFLVLAVWPLVRLLTGRLRALSTVALAGATVVSFAELVLGVRLVEGGLEPSSAAATNDAINRLDGLKMLLLAVLVAGVTVALRRLVARWFTVLGGLTGLALVASALGYLLLSNALASVAFASLPLLIATVVAVAVLTRRVQESRSARTSG